MKIEQFLRKIAEENQELWIRGMKNSDGTKDIYSGVLPAAALNEEQLKELCICDEFSNVKEFGIWKYPNDGELESKIYEIPNYRTGDFKFTSEKINLYCFMFSPIEEVDATGFNYRKVHVRLNK